jgi:hypothetical protein
MGLKASNETFFNNKPLRSRTIMKERLKTIDEVKLQNERTIAYKKYA